MRFKIRSRSMFYLACEATEFGKQQQAVEKISSIAQAMDRSRNWVIEDALKQYIDQQAWYLEGIQQAQASLGAGQGIPH